MFWCSICISQTEMLPHDKPVWNGFQTLSAPLACNFSLVCNFWQCSRQYLQFLSSSRIFLFSDTLWDSLKLIQTHFYSLRLIQTHSDSIKPIRLNETHWGSLRLIWRTLRKMTMIISIIISNKSLFLKRCSASWASA